MTRDVATRCSLGLLIGVSFGVLPVMAAEQGQGSSAQQAAAPAAAANATAPASPTPAAAPAEPTSEQIHQAIQQYVQETTQDEGAFYVDDEVTGDTRELTLDHVHDQVGKTGDYYYVCTDMKDTKTSELLDVDFDVEPYEGQLEVVDVRIHQVNNKPYFTYDDKGNRVPVAH